MNVRLATNDDFDGILRLAGQVEYLFGPMVEDPSFHATVRANIDAEVGIVAMVEDRLVGGLLFTKTDARLFEIGWLAVDEAYRSMRVGRAMLVDAIARWVHPPADIEVIALGPDHPGAASVAFYERLGFEFVEPEDPGADGGSRDRLRLSIDRELPVWATG
ncbi:MAG: GNAT family N-acetyltransferase [Acidimicrobiales bacterium]|nr:GNAT family N-acetyltransferase [Acidimicrobiales bacterium]